MLGRKTRDRIASQFRDAAIDVERLDDNRAVLLSITDVTDRAGLKDVRVRTLLTALQSFADILEAMCPELNWSGTWGPREAYGDGARPKRTHDEIHIWQRDQGGPVVRLTARHHTHDSVIWFEARYEPDEDNSAGQFLGRIRCGEELGRFLEDLVTWTSPETDRLIRPVDQAREVAE